MRDSFLTLAREVRTGLIWALWVFLIFTFPLYLSAAEKAPPPEADKSTVENDYRPSTDSTVELPAAKSADALALKECIITSLQKSVALDSADKTIDGANWEKKKAFTNFLPTFQLEYQYTRIDETPMASTTLGRPVQVGTMNNWELRHSVTQPIFTGFANLSAFELAKLGLNVAEISKEIDRLNLILQVKDAYFAILRTEKNVDVAEQSVKQLDAQLDVASNFFDVGMVPKNDVLQAEVKKAQVVQQKTLAEHQLQYAKSVMNKLLRRPLDAPLEVEDILNYKPFQITLEECLILALQNRPAIRASQRQIDISEERVRLARADYFPVISITASHTKAGDTMAVKGSAYHDANSWAVVALAQWRFWDWGRSFKGVQSRRTDVSKSRNALIQLKDSIELEIKQSYLALQATEKNIFVAEKAVEQAKENFRMSEERYREQVATSTEVTDAETLLTSSRVDYYGALYQFNLAWATLERAMGVDDF